MWIEILLILLAAGLLVVFIYSLKDFHSKRSDSLREISEDSYYGIKRKERNN